MKISSKFKSIQSSIFCAVSILVLSAVLVVTVVSLRYTNSSIYENSVMYTQDDHQTAESEYRFVYQLYG